jgi:NADH-quinone oxidoreductase subunit H
MFDTLFYILVFPGFLFVSACGLVGEFIDRKLYARLQNRIGPPWFQPAADFLKLVAKEDLIPCEANPVIFTLAPLVALTASVTAFLYVPLWKLGSLLSFTGDVIVVLYLLTIPTLCFFIGGWYSTSLFAKIGSARAVTQLFSYEVPLFMSILSAAFLADTWSLRSISAFYIAHPWYCLFNIVGFLVAVVALLGKLEKVPFDIPEAETEVVAGAFTEYSGRLFAFLKLAISVEMIVGASLLAAVFIPFGMDREGPLAFAVYLIKIAMVISLLALIRTVVARLRIDQMVSFCWKYLVPLSVAQLFINLILKGVILK